MNRKEKESEIKKFQDRIQALEAQLAKREEEIDSLRSEHDELKAQNETLIAENKQFFEENQTLWQQNEELIQENEALSLEGEPSSDISGRNKGLLRENQALRDKNDELLERQLEAEEEIDRLRQGFDGALVLKEDEGLRTQNQALTGQNERLWEDNVALTGANTQLLQQLRQNSSYSSKIGVDITERPNFIRSILELPARGLETAFPLEPIKGQVVGEDGGVYFRQFIPYILEEVRSSMCAQRNIIAKKNRPPFQIYCQSEQSRFNEMDDEWEVNTIGEESISFWAYERDLPKLDHGFFNEAVLIVLPEPKHPPKHQKDKSSDKQLEGILAIATTQPNYDDEDNSQRKIKIKLILPKKDYQTHLQALLRAEGKLWLHWLCGLTPSERMYDACLSMPGVEFQQQFIQASLLPWPELSEEPQMPAVVGLNEVQNRVISGLLSVGSGLRLVIGPPGTGKTTTAVQFLVGYANKNPTHRILVCAPSNQAVRVLLMQALQFLPASALALTGVGKNIPDVFQEVYVHKYAGYLFKPLIEYKKELKRGISKNLLDHICQHLFALKEKVYGLVTAPTQMHVKGHFKSKLQDFSAELGARVRSFSEGYQALSAIKLNTQSDAKQWQENLSDHLEGIIKLIQENGFYLESYLLQRSQVVFSTLISSGRGWLRKQIDSFSMILLDEAAQALVPETLIPLCFKPSFYAQFGDPNQLPATITSPAARNKGYENSMMHWLVKELSQPHEMLTIQYRMHPEICSWISKQYYDGRLTTAPQVMQRQSILENNGSLPVVLKKPSLFFNIRGEENRRGGSDLTASCFNLIEAKRVIDVACYLMMRCGFEPRQIGIITFYAEQVNVLLENLHKVMPDRNRARELDIKTVDGFQGGEKDIVLVSVVRTIESVGFLNDWRRLNVAMSRSKHGRWIFGNFDPLSRSNSDLPGLLSEHSERRTVIQEEVLRGHVPSNDYNRGRTYKA